MTGLKVKGSRSNFSKIKILTFLKTEKELTAEIQKYLKEKTALI